MLIDNPLGWYSLPESVAVAGSWLVLLFLLILTLFGCLRVRELRDGRNAISTLGLWLENDDLISHDSTYDSQNHCSKNSKHDSLCLESNRPD